MSFYNSAVKFTRQLLSKQLLNSVARKDIRGHKRYVAPTLAELKRRRDKIGPEKPSPRSSYLEWNYDAEVYAFGKRLNEEFDENLLRTALTNKSYTLDNPDLQDNSSLVEEGDNILQKYIREKFKHYPKNIGEAICDHLMSTSMLAHVASHMGLKDIILTKEFPVEDVTLASTFKAIVAALNGSQDLKRTQTFINDFLIVQIHDNDLFDIWEPQEPYKLLQSELQKRGVTSNIEPRLCNVAGKNTVLAAYRVGLYVDKKVIGIGWGESMQIAQNTAACNALQRLYAI